MMTPEVPSHLSPEDASKRWTSEHVLTAGVQEGWADPEDWHDIDFSARPSFEGPYAFDAEGRPLNRHATAAMPGDRGELGKWGPNYAAESLIVAVGNDGKRRLLLVRRKDRGRSDEEQQWSLPGGMVEAGERDSAAAVREVREEVGVSLEAMPAQTMYRMYANDYRATRNAWIETTGVLYILHHTPEATADGTEISDAHWFELPDTIDELEAVTGKLFASHGDGVRAVMDMLRHFDTQMATAQQLHGSGDFAKARQQYAEAAKLLPDPLEKGRALRGAAAGADRLGEYALAMADARRALEFHEQAVQTFPVQAEVQALRERSASLGVLGRMVVAAAVRQERARQLGPAQARSVAQEGVVKLEWALEDIKKVEQAMDIEPHQYKINLLSRLALAHILYGNKATGRQYARQSRDLGKLSEAPNNPSSAGLGEDYRQQAIARASLRGNAAVGASYLVTPHRSLSRDAVLAIAADRRLGL